MKYARILLAAASELWAMQPEKLQAMLDLLAMQAAGGKFNAEEIAARIGKGEEQAVAKREGAIGILPLRGVIGNRLNLVGNISGGGGASCEQFGAMLRAAMADDQVKAVVLDVDSPGGTAAGADELSAQIFAARGGKPIVAHVNATAASAAYWIASAADEVVLTPSGSVGSIGVFGVHDDISAALEKAGVKKTLIGEPEFKGEGANFLPLSDAAKEYQRAQVKEVYGTFVAALARNRKATLSAVRENYGQGRMLLAPAALAAGMIDRIGTLDETLRRFGASLEPPPTPGRKALAPARERRALGLRAVN
jgi:signal peptide peptidase SppA